MFARLSFGLGFLRPDGCPTLRLKSSTKKVTEDTLTLRLDERAHGPFFPGSRNFGVSLREGTLFSRSLLRSDKILLENHAILRNAVRMLNGSNT
jgi:hypothetical protein